jgi:hypothetical protein
MKRPLSVPLISLLLASAALAQTSESASPILETRKEEKPAPAPATAVVPHAVSPDLAAKIHADLPKYSPTKSETPAMLRKELPDLREIDKPKNTIIRLPKKIVEEKLLPHVAPTSTADLAYGETVNLPPYLVQQNKVPDFKERDLLTPYGKLLTAYKRHPGLNFTIPFLSNGGIGLAMLEEENRLERKSEMEDLAGLYRYSDPKKAAEAKRITDQSFMRTSEP